MTARVRAALELVLGEMDPARDLLVTPAAGLTAAAADLTGPAADLRLLGSETTAAAWPPIIVVSGLDDLAELRTVVERSTGVGTWPKPPSPEALSAAGYRATGWVDDSVPVGRPAAMAGLLLAMKGLIEDRSPWRTWRTAVDTLAPALRAVDRLTVQAERWERDDVDA